jgi:hypothetical protein
MGADSLLSPYGLGLKTSAGIPGRRGRGERVPVNAIRAIHPSRHEGLRGFEDEAVGLRQEPFVAGADAILDRLDGKRGRCHFRHVRLRGCLHLGGVWPQYRGTPATFESWWRSNPVRNTSDSTGLARHPWTPARPAATPVSWPPNNCRANYRRTSRARRPTTSSSAGNHWNNSPSAGSQM